MDEQTTVDTTPEVDITPEVETPVEDEGTEIDSETPAQEEAPEATQTPQAPTYKPEEVTAWQQKAQAYDQFMNQLETKQQGQGQQQDPQTPQTNPAVAEMQAQLKEAGYADEAIEMMTMGASLIFNKINEEKQAEQYNNWASNQIDQAGQLDPRLNDASLVYDLGEGEKVTFGQIVEELVQGDPNWRKGPVQATQKAIKKADAMINASKTQGKQELSEQAKQKAQKFPATNSSPQGATETGKIQTVHDAFEMSKKQLGIA